MIKILRRLDNITDIRDHEKFPCAEETDNKQRLYRVKLLILQRFSTKLPWYSYKCNHVCVVARWVNSRRSYVTHTTEIIMLCVNRSRLTHVRCNPRLYHLARTSTHGYVRTSPGSRAPESLIPSDPGTIQSGGPWSREHGGQMMLPRFADATQECGIKLIIVWSRSWACRKMG